MQGGWLGCFFWLDFDASCHAILCDVIWVWLSSRLGWAAPFSSLGLPEVVLWDPFWYPGGPSGTISAGGRTREGQELVFLGFGTIPGVNFESKIKKFLCLFPSHSS